MDIEIHPIGEAEFAAWSQALATAFGNERRPDQLENDREVMEWDRTLGALGVEPCAAPSQPRCSLSAGVTNSQK